MRPATALISAAKPEPQLAAEAVRAAMARAGTDIAGAVLLFLTAEFARNAHAAVVAASRVANSLSVTGGTAVGVFNEDDWILDRPAACAMVFPVGPGRADHAPCAPLLTLATPRSAAPALLAGTNARYGFVSTDGGAHNPGRIWCHGKMSDEGRCEAMLDATRAAIGAARGVRALTAALPVADARARDIGSVGAIPALDSLLRALPTELREHAHLPLHLVSAGIVAGETEQAISDGRYTLVPVIAANRDDGSVTLAAEIPPESGLFWAMRDAGYAEGEMRALAQNLATKLDAQPDFGLLFSCIGRGPCFFGGDDRDLAVIKERFPGMPLAGVYGGGQIAPLFDGNRVVNNTAVLALFGC